MKGGKLKTQPSLLENLIFFVEVRHSGFLTVMMMLFYDDVMICVFSPDGVYSVVDGEPMHQDPPAAQDESAEEKEEEEKGDEH